MSLLLWAFICTCWLLNLFRLPQAIGIKLYQCQHVCHLGPVVAVPQIPPWGDGWDRCCPLQTLQRRRHFPRSLHHRVNHCWRWVDWLTRGLNFNSSSLGWKCYAGNTVFKHNYVFSACLVKILVFVLVQSHSLSLGSVKILTGESVEGVLWSQGWPHLFSLSWSVWEREIG